MSYHDALNYLAKKTSVVELYDQLGGRVAICPEWNGRVLTSTYDGLDGNSFGCINVQAIETEDFEDFGGEDQWTISPLDIAYSVENITEHNASLCRTIRMADANGKLAELNLSRTVSLLNRQNMGALFGDALVDALTQEDVSVVAFRTKNTIRSTEKVCVASRQRGMFNACPHTFVIVSTPPDNLPDSLMASPLPVDIDYLGGSPHGRIRHISGALLIRVDGHSRCQATMPFSAAPPIFGAIELRFGTLTLWTFDIPRVSEERKRTRESVEEEGADAEEGDIIRIYNHGRPHTAGVDWTTYYEMNCFSVARELLPENSFTFRQCTLHINAGNDILGNLVQQIFDVSLDNFPKDVR